jgi:hypothetical protein
MSNIKIQESEAENEKKPTNIQISIQHMNANSSGLFYSLGIFLFLIQLFNLNIF